MRRTEIERKLNRFERVLSTIIQDLEKHERAIKKHEKAIKELKANQKTFQIELPVGSEATSTTITTDYVAGVDFAKEEKPKKKKKTR